MFRFLYKFGFVSRILESSSSHPTFVLITFNNVFQLSSLVAPDYLETRCE